MKHKFMTVFELKKLLNVKPPTLKEMRMIGPPLRLIMRLGIEVTIYPPYPNNFN